MLFVVVLRRNGCGDYGLTCSPEPLVWPTLGSESEVLLKGATVCLLLSTALRSERCKLRVKEESSRGDATHGFDAVVELQGASSLRCRLKHRLQPAVRAMKGRQWR